ncbi:MAG: hypothetical protein ACTSY1_00015 [Alphaproteobacteria bacterium]
MKPFLRRMALTALALVAAFWVGTPAPAQAQSASIQFDIIKAGYFVGIAGGSGELVFRGRGYPITVGGVSFGLTFGASKSEMIGEVYNLRRPSDIEGIYTELQAGVAVAGGAKVAQLQNSKGVVLHVSGRQVGLELALDLGGIRISLD